MTQEELAAVKELVTDLKEVENKACRLNVADLEVETTGFTIQGLIQELYEELEELQ